MHKRLFIPGPVEVRKEVLDVLSTPMIGHRSKDASALQESISKKLQQLMYTSNTIVLSTSSGSGLMEGAVRSFTGKKAAVFSIGAFGERWYKMCTSNNIPADIFRSELGTETTAAQVDEALASGDYDLITTTHNETATGVMIPIAEIAEVMKKYPEVIWCVDAVSSLGGAKIEVDKLGIDVCIASTQKCLGLPPGLAVASVSDKALAAAEHVKNRGLYFDYLELVKFVKEKPFQYPSTPALSLYYGLDKQLDLILEEGLDARFDRHSLLAKRTQEWASQQFSLTAAEPVRSQTVTCINNDLNISFSELNKKLGERGYQISNGYGALKDKTFRIAHMAETTLEELDSLLAAIDDILPNISKTE